MDETNNNNRMKWLKQNWADTWPPSHSDLAPLEITIPVESAAPAVARIIATMPRWHLESYGAQSIQATRKTRFLNFVDDVVIRFEEIAGGTRIHARSQSRIGRGDLGQNRRNLLELFDAIKKQVRRLP